MIDNNNIDSQDDDFDFEEDLIGTELTSSMQKELDLSMDNTFDPEGNNGLFEDDFDKELGGSTIFTSQDMIDEEFRDIANLRLVQVVGDDKFGKKVIVFYACRLPPTTEIDLNRMWMYVVKTLSQFVTNDYSLIYFHYGLNSKNNPGIKFMLHAYKQIDRDFKKNLKNIFIVHPTNLLKFIINALLPFLRKSRTKVRNKIVKVRRLSELASNFYLDQLTIPEAVKTFDASLNSPLDTNKQFPGHTPSQQIRTQFYEPLPQSQFGVSLQHIHQHHPKHAIPPVMEECIRYLRKTECLQCEGIFRRCAPKSLLEETQRQFDIGEYVDLDALGQPHLVAGILKTFLRSLREPLMTFELYDSIVQIHNSKSDEVVSIIRVIVSEMLPHYNYNVLKFLTEFLIDVSVYSEQNKMNAQNLANVFAPNLIWSRNEASLTVIHIFIRFTLMLIQHYKDIFVRSDDF